MNFHWRSLEEESQERKVSECGKSHSWEKELTGFGRIWSCGDVHLVLWGLQQSLQRTDGSVRLDCPLLVIGHVEALILAGGQSSRLNLHGVPPGLTSSAFVSMTSISLFLLRGHPFSHATSFHSRTLCARVQGDALCVSPLKPHLRWVGTTQDTLRCERKCLAYQKWNSLFKRWDRFGRAQNCSVLENTVRIHAVC